jgi:hypothetical protein
MVITSSDRVHAFQRLRIENSHQERNGSSHTSSFLSLFGYFFHQMCAILLLVPEHAHELIFFVQDVVIPAREADSLKNVFLSEAGHGFGTSSESRLCRTRYSSISLRTTFSDQRYHGVIPGSLGVEQPPVHFVQQDILRFARLFLVATCGPADWRQDNRWRKRSDAASKQSNTC